MAFPAASPTSAYWQKDVHQLGSKRTTAELPERQEVLIIGAGFSGVACAYYLANAAKPPSSITIVEARDACSGATGRNGGHLRPEALATFSKFAEKLGAEAAFQIANFEVENANAVAQLVQDLKIDCDFKRIVSANAYLDAEMAKEARSHYDALCQGGFDARMKYQFYDADQAESITGVHGAKAAITFTAFSLWPYKFILHLLGLATQKGVNLQTHTPVICISSSQNDEGYWTITTDRGSTEARNVIFATNGYTAGLLPEFTDIITPVRGICSHITASSAHRDMPHFSQTVKSMGLKHSPGCQDYLISRPDGSVIVGGAWKVVRPGPMDHWYNVTDDSKLIPAAEGYYNGFLERTFNEWRAVESRVSDIWTGIMGYTSDSMPHVGPLDKNRRGLFICAGFNGHGMPQVLLCAKGLAKMMLESCEFSETGIPKGFCAGDKRCYT